MKSMVKMAIFVLPMLLVGCAKEDNTTQSESQMLYQLENAIKNPTEVRGLQVTFDEFNGTGFTATIFPKVEFFAITQKDWTVWPPVGIDIEFPDARFDKLEGLTGLKELDISGIPIRSLPNSLAALDNLEVLHVCLYLPESLEKDARVLKSMKSLRHLDLGNSVFAPHQQSALIAELKGVEISESTVTAPEFQDSTDTE